MTGLDKMINQIQEEAKISANAKIEEANQMAMKIMDDAQVEAQSLVEDINAKSKADVANHKDRVKSAADLKKRTAILTAKQELIAQVIEKAYEKFCAMDDDAYFQTVKGMLEKFLRPQDGEVFFSDKDLAKMPAAFAKDVEEIAKKAGGSLTISTEGRQIEKGFILAYGGIEENCSFKALFDAKRDELQDQVQKILFS